MVQTDNPPQIKAAHPLSKGAYALPLPPPRTPPRNKLIRQPNPGCGPLRIAG